ncbi:GNAT family N-acetyltransferase [Marinococcus luteus]|uniref:GNAT family N-acetyltransferase n=1 Tax=Marinococcus luteus TaxID=1122204 RepID=UPI002ACCD09C|nr:GNAT family N-acetyltransferase [Marinococcus luteus]MDZ5782020.1 GNAT family N-acetyltransferase [Marinococcus luteus]
MSEQIILRPVAAEDEKDINILRRQPSVMHYTLGLPSERRASSQSFIEGLKENDHVIVTEYGGRVVGIGSLEVLSGKLHYYGLTAMAVHDEFQHRGIGSRLLDHLLDIADNYLGLLRLELDVVEGNARAVQLYKSRGFEPEGTLRKAHFAGGAFYNVLVMGRLNTELFPGD